MRTVLLTGGAGFFGGLLKQRLLDTGCSCVSIDLHKDDTVHPNLTAVQGDIRDRELLERIFAEHRFDAVLHIAAMLAHGNMDERLLWTSNVDATLNIAELAKKYKVPKVIFTSSNCLWGEGVPHAITEEEPPNPIEIYGRSKLEGEKILQRFSNDFHAIIIRCPTIIDFGRLGLLSILFEFIHEGRKVWVVGSGRNKYQFIYAGDLADACIRCIDYDRSAVFNIGSDNVKSLRAVYEYVAQKAQSGAQVASLPQGPTLLAMRVAHLLKVSPLGPYHYKMIAQNFMFDTSKIKRSLGWTPTLTNEEMLWRAYQYYQNNRSEIENRQDVSAHKQGAKMGIIRVLKWIS
ncbi:MAG: NAD(P)-dependent oxidoreductase [Acidobacteriaceae bacterium]|nr:NAD(P)-dependent oxidoreductase [Acidobacteriaceae bacterium]MBV9304657.1 NAD(P)-dependent oxidoreductase [Acidobacteriaceae bacterium]MBV9939739.1 NAD(P)-dependent oxidoreductase [Acidobacteriaceae bacterium]